MTTLKRIMIATLVFNGIFGSAFGESLAEQITSNILGNTNWVQDNSAVNQMNSREQNALDAQTQGRTGSAMAIAAGVTMITTGIPMILSLDPVRVAAGSELIAKGGIELAQGASNAEGAAYNANQRMNLNGGFSGASNPMSLEQQQQIQEALSNPSFDKMLSDSGINADQFKEKLVSGSFTSGNEVLDLMGKNIDPEIFKEGQKVAGDQFSKIFGSSSLPAEQETTTGDASKSFETGNLTQNIQQGNNLNRENLSDSNGNIPSVQAISTNHALAKNSPSSGKLAGTTQSDPLNSFLQKMFGGQSLLDPEDQKAMLRQEALSAGVQMPVKGVSIFSLAHRKYNEFGKSRKRPSRIAQR